MFLSSKELRLVQPGLEVIIAAACRLTDFKTLIRKYRRTVRRTWKRSWQTQNISQFILKMKINT